MQGPYSPGTFSKLPAPSELSWERTGPARGQTYRVIKAFDDADGHEHPVGERWLFLGGMFNKFDDEWTLCVQLSSGEEWKIPLSWRADKQGNVLEHWQAYLTHDKLVAGRGTP